MEKTNRLAMFFMLTLALVIGANGSIAATNFPDGTLRSDREGPGGVSYGTPVVAQSTSSPQIVIDLDHSSVSVIYTMTTTLAVENETLNVDNFTYAAPNSGTTLSSASGVMNVTTLTVTENNTHLTFSINMTLAHNTSVLVLTFTIDDILTVAAAGTESYDFSEVNLESGDDGYETQQVVTNADAAMAVDNLQLKYTWYTANGFLYNFIKDSAELDMSSVTYNESEYFTYNVGSIAAADTDTWLIQEKAEGEIVGDEVDKDDESFMEKYQTGLVILAVILVLVAIGHAKTKK